MLEANFARLLNHLQIPYRYEARTFNLPRGGRYTPDFYLEEPLGAIPAGWVELKGWRRRTGTVVGQKRYDLFRRSYPQETFSIVAASDPVWKEFVRGYAAWIDGWETPTRNLRTHPDHYRDPTRPLTQAPRGWRARATR
jgi:hypothetical protein